MNDKTTPPLKQISTGNPSLEGINPLPPALTKPPAPPAPPPKKSKQT